MRDRVRIYAWVGGDDPARSRDAVRAQVEAGFTAVKMNGCRPARGRSPPRADVDGSSSGSQVAREVLGPDRDVAVDFHGRASRANARRILPALEPLRPLFVEEPLLPDERHGLRDVVASTSIPIATGERLYSRWDFRPPSTAGSPSRSPTSATPAASPRYAGSPRWPRCTALAGPALPARPDRPGGEPAGRLRHAELPDPGAEHGHPLQHRQRPARLPGRPSAFRFVDGHINRLDGPGLGIEIDEDAVRAADERVTPGATRSGGTTTARSPSGEETAMTFSTGFGRRRLLAIVRGDDTRTGDRSIEVLAEEGIDLVEVSLTSNGALAVITAVRGYLGDAVTLGAGTVLTAEQARAALDAGATYLVTPSLSAGADEGVRLGVPVLMGALTPTEVATAVDRGATAVKLFPAELGGPSYLAALRAPFPDVPFVPVGGVDGEMARESLLRGP